MKWYKIFFQKVFFKLSFFIYRFSLNYNRHEISVIEYLEKNKPDIKIDI